MILNSEEKIFFVDFGLSEKNNELEAQGVDLHLMKRALQSTHYHFWEECFKYVFCGYSSVLGSETAEKVYEKIKEIAKARSLCRGKKTISKPACLTVRLSFLLLVTSTSSDQARSVLNPYGFAVAMLCV